MARRSRSVLTGLIVVVLLVAVAAIFLPRNFRGRATKQQRQEAATAQHQRQPPRQPSVLEATRDSLIAEREWNATLSDSLYTMYSWFREAYESRVATRESLAVFMATADSLTTQTASLQTRLDQAAGLAWTLMHGKEIAVRERKAARPAAVRVRRTERTIPSSRPFINRRGGDINVRAAFVATAAQVPEGTTYYQRGTYSGSQVTPPAGRVSLTPPGTVVEPATPPTSTPAIRGLSDQAANVERNSVYPLKPAWDPNDPGFRNRTRKDPVAVAKSGDGQFTVAVLIRVIPEEGSVRMGLVKNGRMSTERDKTVAGERIGSSNVVVFGPFKGPGAIVRVNFPVYKPSDVHGPDSWAQFFWDDGRKKFPYVIQGDNDGIVIDFRQ